MGRNRSKTTNVFPATSRAQESCDIPKQNLRTCLASHPATFGPRLLCRFVYEVSYHTDDVAQNHTIKQIQQVTGMATC